MSPRQLEFNHLVQGLHADLFRFAFWLSKSKQLAEDVLQEAFLRAWKSLENLRDREAAKAWLMTIVRREYLRTFERKQLDIVELEELPVPDLSSASHDERHDAITLRSAMLSLAPKYRLPLVMQVMAGMSCAEIAEELGLGEQAVMTQLFRAREQLKQTLQVNTTESRGENIHALR